MSSLEGKMSSLEEKMLTGREYDKVIQEAEQVSTLAVIFTLFLIFIAFNRRTSRSRRQSRLVPVLLSLLYSSHCLLLTGVHQDPGVFASVLERGADQVSRPYAPPQRGKYGQR